MSSSSLRRVLFFVPSRVVPDQRRLLASDTSSEPSTASIPVKSASPISASREFPTTSPNEHAHFLLSLSFEQRRRFPRFLRNLLPRPLLLVSSHLSIISLGADGSSSYSRNFARLGPEARLASACVGGVLFPVGCFIFAWTSYPTIHWVASCIGVTILVTGIFFICESFPLFRFAFKSRLISNQLSLLPRSEYVSSLH